MSVEFDWSDDAFFEEPVDASVDGGTTSSGHLWHRVSSRWGHSMHSMCSYYGMFPAKVAHYFIRRYSQPGDVILDPFSGRGTTALQARVEERVSIANDLNPLAFILTRAKSDPPDWDEVNSFVDGLQKNFHRSGAQDLDVPDEIRMLYHDNTLEQLLYVRKMLPRSLASMTRSEAMIAGSLAGIMHGGWRRDGTSQYLSISMPNTFSMAPSYVEKFIRENGLRKPDQDLFERLRDKLARLYQDGIEGAQGTVHNLDAVSLMSDNHLPANSVDLIVTSPPYLQVVNYGASNWIRLWLLGIEDVSRGQGMGRKSLDAALDHRHTYNSYAKFILRTLLGMERVLKRDGVAVVVIGDVAEPGKDPVPLAAKVWADVRDRTNLRLIELIEDELPVHTKVSRIWGETKGQATSRDCALVLTHRDGNPVVDRTIDWDEPYKDAGPDAAHERLAAIRAAINLRD